LSRRAVECDDGARLSWKLDRDVAALAEEMPSDEVACQALGSPATCGGGVEVWGEEADTTRRSLVYALVERDGVAAGILCSWPAAGEPPALCGALIELVP
jgi:hypothetical protein